MASRLFSDCSERIDSKARHSTCENTSLTSISKSCLGCGVYWIRTCDAGDDDTKEEEEEEEEEAADCADGLDSFAAISKSSSAISTRHPSNTVSVPIIAEQLQSLRKILSSSFEPR